MAYLEVKNINKNFGHVQALVGASLVSYEGEVLAIVGDNGAGKTTLIKIISGVLSPDSGTVSIGGREFSSLSVSQSIEAGVSTVYQDLALGNTMDVTANLFLGREITKLGFLDKKEMRRKSEELLKSLDINIPDVTVPVGNLSGGQRQGVAVARLINQGGKVFIFDEPTAAMGISETSAVLRLIRKLADDDGLFVPCCRECHNEIHHNGTAGKLSKIIGQLAFELNENAHKGEIKDAREKFRTRYGRSYL